jgi:SAM-dependent methyltransferase
MPIDRYYIEGFLRQHQSSIKGQTLEVGDDSYTRRFGENRTTRRDVLHVHDGNSAATIVGDLASADHIPGDTFDCLVLTQTLHLIFDVTAAVRTIHRVLRPGGVVLATFPGISQLSTDEWNRTWSWGLSCALALELFGERFEKSRISVQSYGNTLTAACFLHGLAASELSIQQLDRVEPDCEMLVAVRAEK